MKGTVKWFNRTKGYGFITAENSEEYFVHYSDIDGEGFKALREGESVVFEPSSNEKGNCAVHVTLAK